MNPCTNCGSEVGDENPPNASHCGKCPPRNCPDCGQMCDYRPGGQLCPCWISLEGMPLADVKALPWGVTMPWRFHRDQDISGVSGVGIVAEGVAFTDGTVALRWLGGWPTSVVFHDRGIEAVNHIHGHSGATRIVWLDEPR